ncbi:helix-turn-helix domain-containing protein [Alkaliphilus metalliredigens]|uniref:helix-turn-helix domain-containing protein n=1 Tax=Alkaliphilus metalliredigens TaxID=208226 RepID=UPI00005CCE00
MKKKYIVKLTNEEHQELTDIISKGKSPAYKIKHANILLKANTDGPNWIDRQIAEAFNCHSNTITNVKKRFVEEGLDSALDRKKRDPSTLPRKFDGVDQAKIIALACSTPLADHSHWTLRLLANKVVELNIVDSISHQTVSRILKKMT